MTDHMLRFYPDSVLQQRCIDVESFDNQLKTVVDQMIETMYAHSGVGLAAPQVGLLQNLVVIDHTAGESSTALLMMVNPKIVGFNGHKVLSEEGCLSLPGVVLYVPRSQDIDVEYSDVDGVKHATKFTNDVAFIVQHELDHLAGLTLLDKIGPMARRLALKKLEL